MKKYLIVFFLACTIFRVDAAFSAQDVTVEGVLNVGEFYGPPNYGENPDSDSIEHSYLLQLPAPIGEQVQNANAYSSIENKNGINGFAYFIQLVVSNADQTNAKTLIGKRVKVVGSLFDAITGHHRTPVLIEVHSLSPIDKYSW